MIRFFGSIFSALTSAALFAVAGAFALVHLFGNDLPKYDELVNYQPKMLSRVYSGEGKVIAQFATEQRVFVPIDEVPELVKEAFISAEDKNFYLHPGVDAVGIAKAVVRFAQARASGGDTRLSGASTITQQVMKNFLVGNERSVERKIKEAILAVRLDGALSKDQILELYLNEIFLGARSYGILAAAQNYFGKALEDLTPAEAAYLAALPKAPSDLHPVRNRDRAISRRNYVIRQMEENGYLSAEEAQAAMESAFETLLDGDAPVAALNPDPDYFTAEVRRQMVREVGQDQLYEGGLSIRATIEPDLQAIAGRALRRGLEGYDRGRAVWHGTLGEIQSIAEGTTDDWRAALAAYRVPRDIEGWNPAVVLEVGEKTAIVGVEGIDAEGPDGPGTVRLQLADEKWIRAVRRGGKSARAPQRGDDLWQKGDVFYVAPAEEGESWRMHQIPDVQGAFMAMDPASGRVLALWGGFSYEQSVFNRATQALRQPGSSFKPFVYAAALDAGYTPATIVLDAPVVVRQAGAEDWRPKNSSGRFYGPSPLRVGLEQSRNLMTIRIAQQVGMDRIATYAERFGVYENMPHHLSYALGAGETTLYEMVAAYGMFANGGKRVRPTVIDRIQDRNGNTLYAHDPRFCRGCEIEGPAPRGEPLLFDQRSQIMNPVTAHQIVSILEGVVARGTASRTVGGLGFPVAGKTGTTNDAKDAWFIGFTPSMVAGCFIGYDNPEPMGRGAYGGTLCGPVFREFMAEAMKTRVPGEFRAPETGGMVTVKIDRLSGERLPDDASGPDVIVEVFQQGTEPELYAEASAIAGDEELFGSFGGDLPFALAGEEADSGWGSGALPPDSEGSGDAGARRPQPNVPSVGLGTGGLY
ncbi:penicillin-binding protein 1A [Limibaculum sp. M0105]|uniref:Penicillin-binding protein 1A n=1 Tax=Thermohalobaculum xanthum TaxID=2753746 RepID=A0A8J7SCM2_9RHOB|nr:penicillin-binding protein 1A [Thermohalobaculum xanthum]MBK0397977.1 penicillin-binding protein 1A [Thermohalobaculum xanthum]